MYGVPYLVFIIRIDVFVHGFLRTSGSSIFAPVNGPTKVFFDVSCDKGFMIRTFIRKFFLPM